MKRAIYITFFFLLIQLALGSPLCQPIVYDLYLENSQNYEQNYTFESTKLHDQFTFPTVALAPGEAVHTQFVFQPECSQYGYLDFSVIVKELNGKTQYKLPFQAHIESPELVFENINGTFCNNVDNTAVLQLKNEDSYTNGYTLSGGAFSEQHIVLEGGEETFVEWYFSSPVAQNITVEATTHLGGITKNATAQINQCTPPQTSLYFWIALPVALLIAGFLAFVLRHKNLDDLVEEAQESVEDSLNEIEDTLQDERSLNWIFIILLVLLALVIGVGSYIFFVSGVFDGNQTINITLANISEYTCYDTICDDIGNATQIAYDSTRDFLLENIFWIIIIGQVLLLLFVMLLIYLRRKKLKGDNRFDWL